MSSERTFDAIVVGAGPAGEVCAGRMAAHGLNVVMVERELVGGECSYYACMPSKALLRPGELVDEAGRVPGVRLAQPPLDPPEVLTRRDEVIHDLDDSVQLPWLEKRGIELVRGQARLDGERRVLVGDEVLQARRAIVIATGSSASRKSLSRAAFPRTASRPATVSRKPRSPSPCTRPRIPNSSTC